MRYLMSLLSLLVSSPLQCPRSSASASPHLPFPILKRMVASWYGPRFEGKKMASGIRFCSTLPVIAHKKLPLGTLVRLRRGESSVIGIVLDRGPWIKGRDLDISWGLASKLGLLRAGVGEVTVEVLGVEPRERWGEALYALA